MEEEEPACPVRLARSLKSSFPCPLPAAPSPTPPHPSAHNSQGWIQKRKHVATKAARVGLHRYRIRIRAVSVPDDLYVRAYGYTVYILPTGRGRSGSAPVHPGPGVERVVHVSGARRALAGPAPCLLRRCIPSLCAVDRGLVGFGRFRGGSVRPATAGLTARTTAPGAPAVGALDRAAGGARATCQCDAATAQDLSVATYG